MGTRTASDPRPTAAAPPQASDPRQTTDRRRTGAAAQPDVPPPGSTAATPPRPIVGRAAEPTYRTLRLPSVSPAVGATYDRWSAERILTTTTTRDPKRRERRLLATVLLAGTALVVVASLILASLVADDDEPSATAADAQSAVAPPPAAAPAAPPAAPSDRPSAAPGTATGGLVATVSVTGDLLEVSEVIRWPDGGPAELLLELPELSVVPGVAAELQPRVEDLQVVIDGNIAQLIEFGDPPNSWIVQPSSGNPPQVMEVRYLLTGAIARSTPSQPGRALAVIAPLSQGTNGSSPVEVRLTSDSVLTVACPGAADVEAMLCGREDGGIWTARPPAGEPAVVVIQLDLAPPG